MPAEPTRIPPLLERMLAEQEKRIIETALIQNSQHRQQTADWLGIHRTTLFKKMRQHGLITESEATP